MAEIDLKTSPRTTRSGIVFVYDSGGNLLRSYRISGAECSAILSGQQRIPSGATQEEWESGRACMSRVGVEVGEIAENSKGDLVAIIGEHSRGGVLYRDALEIPAGSYTGIPPLITLKEPIIMDDGQEQKIVSIVDGKASWQ